MSRVAFERAKFEVEGALALRQIPLLDEVVTDDSSGRLFVFSDADYCEKRQAPLRWDRGAMSSSLPFTDRSSKEL